MTNTECPDCGGVIGSRRSRCKRCNRFAQAVLRRTSQLAQAEEPELFERLKHTAEAQVYHETVVPDR